jgi:hypothetical protein
MSTSNVLVVAAPLATMAASGDGYVETQQHATAAHTTITHEFSMDVPAGADLFKAFYWEDVNTEGAVDASSGETDFTITLDHVKFVAALKALIDGAEGGKLDICGDYSTDTSYSYSAGSVTGPSNLGLGVTPIAQTILDREIRLEVEAELDTNGVLEYLEGDSLGGFNLFLESSGGAEDMAGKLDEDGSGNTVYLRNLLLQFPNRTDVVGSTDASGNLPVKAGDAVAFVFNVSPEVTVEQRNQLGPDAGAGTTNNEAANDLGPTTNMTLNNTTFLTTGTRKIVFIAKVV